MPVCRIERVISGAMTGRVERGSDGLFACHVFGSNVDPLGFATLDEVADFLRSTPRAGVRMNPNWVRITKNIYIDGIWLR